jgi:isopenicillin-N epimerase
MINPIKASFLLDPSIIFLNHGSFGACPRPVFEAYQAWQRELESQPVLFMGRKLSAYDQAARHKLGAYLHADPNDLAFISNVTYGVNVIARSLEFTPGDEILTTDHEYGACNATWEYACQKTGAIYKSQPIPLPVHSAEAVVEQFWQGVTERTRLIYLSHITSPTALRLPVEAICAKARQAGIMTMIDGAHAPGQLSLDLEALGADFYVGNCHKWMLSPKGAGFLHARPEVHHLIVPLVVSWAYQVALKNNRLHNLDYVRWTGTRDPAAQLSVSAAIEFMETHDWNKVQQVCHQLLQTAIQDICNLVEMKPLYPMDSDLFYQMGIAPLPPDIDLSMLKTRLYDEHRVEVPMVERNGQKFIRISVQGYNTKEDLENLVRALEVLLPQCQEKAQ